MLFVSVIDPDEKIWGISGRRAAVGISKGLVYSLVYIPKE
jgi:hypothetical protein